MVEAEVGGNKYQVNLTLFEGPLDLLLHLVTKNRIDIHDIPIHEITDQYLAYLAEADRFNLDLGSDFFTMASTLLLIKSRMLLPKTRSDESVDEEEDPRTELARSIEDFRRMKECKARLEELLHAEAPYWKKEPEDISGGLYTGTISLERLTGVFMALYEELQPATVRMVEADIVSMDDRMDDLRRRLRNESHVDVHSYFRSCKTRVRLAMSLMALLELLRMGEVALRDTLQGLIIETRTV